MGGKTLLVDFNAQYGLFAHFVEPVFRQIGLSVFNFSLVMSLLLAISYAFVFVFIYRTISNNFLRVSAFFLVLFFSYGFTWRLGQDSPDSYFQYWPIRTVFPMMTLFLSCLSYRTRPLNSFLFTFLIALGIFWNQDTGIVAYVTWILCLIYNKTYTMPTRWQWANLQSIIWGIVIFVVSVISVYGFLTLRSGKSLNLDHFFFYQKLFAGSGYYMLPMPLAGLWVVIASVYITGLAIALYNLLKRKHFIFSRSVFACSILGLGLFLYYQGRSFEGNLLPVSYPAIILVFLFADKILKTMQSSKRLEIQKVIMFALLFFFAVDIMGTILLNSSEFFTLLKLRIGALKKNRTPEVSNDIYFLKQQTHPGEKIYLAPPTYEVFDDSYKCNLEGVYYAETGTSNALNIEGCAERVLVASDEKFEKVVKSTRGKHTKIFIAESEADKYTGFRIIARSSGGDLVQIAR